MRSIERKKGFAICGRNTNNMRFVDYTVLIAEEQEKLQDTLTKIKEASKCR